LSASTASSAEAGPPTIAALPSLDPAWTAAQAITCDDRIYFSPAILAQPGNEQDGIDPPGQALKAYLAEPRPEEMATRPATGWHRVGQTATQVEFVAIATDASGLWFVLVSGTSGQWEPDSAGTCSDQVRRPPGFGPADWMVDRNQPVARDDTIVHALLREEACASGQSPKGRVAPPSVVYLDNAVVVTLSVRHLAGVQDCVGNPLFAVDIRLDQPLGDRRLLDGGRFPPGDPAAELP
jgi:hypothetical protein